MARKAMQRRVDDLEQRLSPHDQIAVIDVNGLPLPEQEQAIKLHREQMQRDGIVHTPLVVIDF